MLRELTTEELFLVVGGDGDGGGDGGGGDGGGGDGDGDGGDGDGGDGSTGVDGEGPSAVAVSVNNADVNDGQQSLAGDTSVGSGLADLGQAIEHYASEIGYGVANAMESAVNSLLGHMNPGQAAAMCPNGVQSFSENGVTIGVSKGGISAQYGGSTVRCK